MDPWFDLASTLDNKIRTAAEAVLGDAGLEPDVRPADPRFGDFQANGVLPYAKRAKTNPRQIATRIVEQLALDPELQGAATVDLAGPGFINFRLTSALLLDWLQAYSTEADLQRGADAFYHGKNVAPGYRGEQCTGARPW